MRKYSLAKTLKNVLLEVSDDKIVVGFSIRESYSSIYPLTYEDIRRYRPDFCRYPDEALILLPSKYKIKKMIASLKEAKELGSILLHYLPVVEDISLAGYVYLVYSPFFIPEDLKGDIRIEAPLDGACDRVYKAYKILNFKDGSRIVVEGEKSFDHCGWESMTEKYLKLKEIIGEEPVDIEEYEEIPDDE